MYPDPTHGIYNFIWAGLDPHSLSLLDTGGKTLRKKLKKCKEIDTCTGTGSNCYFIKQIKENLGQLHMFFYFCTIFVFFNSRKLVIR